VVSAVPGGATALNRFCGPGSKYVPKFVDNARTTHNHAKPIADNSCGGRNINQPPPPSATMRSATATATPRRDEDDNSCGGGAVANGYMCANRAVGGEPASATAAGGIPYWMRGVSQQCDTRDQHTSSKGWNFDFQCMRWELDGHVATVPAADSASSLTEQEPEPVRQEQQHEEATHDAVPAAVSDNQQHTRDMRMQRFALPHAAACDAGALLSDTASAIAAANRLRVRSPVAATKRPRTLWLPPAETTQAQTETDAEATTEREVTWTMYTCQDNTAVFLQAQDVTHETVAAWVDGNVSWPAMCGLALSDTHRACGRPGPPLAHAAAEAAQRDIADWLAAARVQQEAEAALETAQARTTGGEEEDAAVTTNVPPTDAAKEALVAIAAALRGDGVSAAAPVPRMVDDHAHQQRQGENSTDAAVRRSGESVLWAERRQRKAAEERLVTAQARIAALEAALAAAELPLP